MTDESIMPWGKHKGKKLANVPVSYLLFMYREKNLKPMDMLTLYIEDNLEDLESEARQEERERNHTNF